MSEPSALDVSAQEAQRLLALESFQLADPSADLGIGKIIQHAQRIFRVPIAMASFVAENQQFFRASIGLTTLQMPRDQSFCTRTIQGDDVLVVPDALQDERFRQLSSVTGEPHIRFYAGAPLISRDGFVLGALCVIDTTERPEGLTVDECQSLTDLAELVMDKLELRRLSTVEVDARRRFDAVAGSAADAIICADGANRITSWNKAAERMFGLSAAQALGQSVAIIMPEKSRPAHETGMREVLNGRPSKLIGSLFQVPALRSDGSEFQIELSLSHWMEGGEHRFGAIARDITARLATEARLKHAAEYDPLTGLANRTLLNAALLEASEAGRPLSLIMIDLDGFKDVNDSLGHAAGDAVLIMVAERLRALTATKYLPCRLGGDEFVIILDGVADPFTPTYLAEALVESIECPFEFNERSVYIGASAGIALMTGDAWNIDLPLEQADLALYRAKSEGKGRARLFTPDMSQSVQSRVSVSSGIRQAWERGEFELFYQPQVRLCDGAVVGAEALIRWNHPERGVLAPGTFLSTLENSLLAVPVSEWILNSACTQAALWRDDRFPDFRIGVNLFAAQFRSGDLTVVVDRVLRQTGLCATALELEITENTILRNELRINAMLTELRERGVGIAFDDYGTGFASLTMLKDFPVTRLKIDRSFVSGDDPGNQNELIVDAISRLAQGLKLDVIAEGIETYEQADLMTRYCSEGQGYLYGRPMPASAFEAAFSKGFQKELSRSA